MSSIRRGATQLERRMRRGDRGCVTQAEPNNPPRATARALSQRLSPDGLRDSFHRLTIQQMSSLVRGQEILDHHYNEGDSGRPSAGCCPTSRESCRGALPAHDGSVPRVAVDRLNVSMHDRALRQRNSPRETRDWAVRRALFAGACCAGALPRSRLAGSSPTRRGLLLRPRPQV